ncbi:TonB-dependent receptor [Apibacter raozihei]|uniref:TonB-dependent receptor plug domain-containing protein n=1 Tax=Apibacter raozihei TaxID=2500547 RepID=UPI000FE2B292|nr:TonB-dependent receptor [Apibacter raozihei]
MKNKISALIFCAGTTFIWAQNHTSDSLSKVFELGEINVIEKGTKRILTNQVDEKQLREFDRNTLTDAVNLLPGVTISEFGARGEGNLSLRGFSMLQTPIFYDGIPIYVPYDGNVDINRFTTFDIAKISVSKGFTSVLYGPNTMGGAINIISRKPIKPLEISGISGIKFSKEGLNNYSTSLNIGSRINKFYFLGNVSHIKNNFNSLSEKFKPGTNEGVGKRNHSEYRDWKLSGKVGYMPNKTDEYSLNFIIQEAQKDIAPPVEGSMYRDYPQYNKYSIYYRSNTYLGAQTSLSLTGFYDNYYNKMNQYDNNEYFLQNTKKAFRSIYDDYSLGGSINLSTEYFKNNILKLSFHEKFDSHKEHNATIPQNLATGQKEIVGEPIQKYLDNTLSVGIEDVFNLNKYFTIIAGASYNYRNNIKAQDYGTHYETGEKNILFDFPKGSDNAFNYQLGTIYKPAEHHEISLSASRKSRFASQKERYSSRFGSQIPNPDLSSEYSWIFDFNYKGQVSSALQYELSFYRNNVSNAIYQITVGKQEDGNPIYQNRNQGKAVFQGLELSFNYRPIKNINVGANYSFIELKNKKDKSLEYTNIPKHKLIVFGKYNLTNWDAYLHLDMEINSNRYITSVGETISGFTLVNVKVHSKIWKGFSGEIGSKNLLDKNYYLSKNYPREGRTFFTSLLYNF